MKIFRCIWVLLALPVAAWGQDAEQSATEFADSSFTVKEIRVLGLARVSEGSEKAHWQERANLLTPVAKAFSTDIGSEVASLGNAG